MNYFKNKQNQIFAYDDLDIEKVAQYKAAGDEEKAGYSQVIINISKNLKYLTAIDEAEKDALLAPTPEQLKEQDIAEAKQYLASTDFYFTVDKYATLTEERKAELKYKREDARTLINLLEVTDVEG